jgi:hypothetical protein
MAYVDATSHTLVAAELEIVLLKDCGHYWHECPDEALAQVRAFLGPRIGMES